MFGFHLDSYAARSCPVKTHNDFNPRVDLPVGSIDNSLNELFEGGQVFKEQVLRELIGSFGGSLTDLRRLHGRPPEVQEEACIAALTDGIDVIIGGRLPSDPVGHRSGRPDLLVRATDDGPARYRPVQIKGHLVRERRKSGRSNTWTMSCSPVGDPLPQAAVDVPDSVFRTSRAPDLLQLGHYWRLLEAAGFAAPAPWAGVIGTDQTDLTGAGHLLRTVTWVDLTEPFLRTFSRSDDKGWTKRSVLDRYDHEHGFRVQVARNALAQLEETPPPPLVLPIATSECRTCPWWSHCRPQLDDDDISLRIDRSPLDVREISVLRARGIRTIDDLAGIDVEAFLPDYLPEVTHRDQAEGRFRLAARRANLLLQGVTLEKQPGTQVDLPLVDIEIDFDIETSSDDRVYLWGFLVHYTQRDQPPEYVEFSAWEDLDDESEGELAGAAAGRLLSWLQEPATVRVYHYSDYERRKLRQLAERTSDPRLVEVCSLINDTFVDLLPAVREQWFGTDGLGLKVVASEGAGFQWRDDAPGGLNSQSWFDEATHSDDSATREQARIRVLEYNEDDVRATAAVRNWLREQNA